MAAEMQRSGQERIFGARARIGLIVPTTNTVNEAEWQQLAIEGVSFHTTRMPLHSAGEGEDPVSPALRSALDQLTPAGLSCIAYGCTAGSMIQPVTALPEAMSELAALPCTSTAEAIVAGLGELGIHRVAVATPYHDALNAQWRTFLEDCDFEVSAIRGLGIGAGGAQEFTRICRLAMGDIEKHARDTFAAAPAEALLLSCTDMPTLPLLEKLEQALGVPVLSSNTATLWRALTIAGIDAALPQGGALLAGRRA
jgi:maleate isomerase/arylmalonate decarboxylase